MLFRLVLVCVLFVLYLVECQLSKYFVYMAARPTSTAELFRVISYDEFHCIYICAPLPQCHTILYIASESECAGYVGHGDGGDPLDGAVAMTTGKSTQLYESLCFSSCACHINQVCSTFMNIESLNKILI